jgi:hypothetical protein
MPWIGTRLSKSVWGIDGNPNSNKTDRKEKEHEKKAGAFDLFLHLIPDTPIIFEVNRAERLCFSEGSH